ncbi:LPS-assembly protein LptD [Terriglobus aquaticus]|uniref:LPS-assembly protein LptD n=1 Tax=Terriglobus aquaticus TaxID=940139 RepID=A0ABW9KF41_9BACT|nr:LPS assembly protein LptD [Terriglobus aquaticus]
MSADAPSGDTPAATALPEDPAASRYPMLEELQARHTNAADLQYDHAQYAAGHLILDGHVTIVYAGYTFTADHVDYDRNTGQLNASGHLKLTGGKSDESVQASHGTLNLRTQAGTFYDVAGSVGLRQGSGSRIYTVGNPFLFQGRMLVKHGPEDFELFDGSVTSCQLPHPDWRLSSAHFVVHNGKAAAHGTVFRLLNVPVLYLPVISHPVPQQGADQRQSGILIPVVGQSSTKGFILGEQIYFALSRSTDMTVGAEYFSRRGWQQSATFRWRGRGLDFLNAHYSNLLDRGFQGTVLQAGPNGTVTSTVGYVNQGGEDILVSGRKDFTPHLRSAVNAEYLSSYAYRQAFTDTFNQAVATDIVSDAFATWQNNGYIGSIEGDRYQGLKRTITGEQVRILHLPQLDGETTEHRIGNTPLLWTAMVQSSAIKRTQGTGTASTQFNTGVVERFDVRPSLSLPLHFDGFALRGTVAVRDTWYSASRVAAPLPGPTPVERSGSLNRSAFEAEAEFRTPVLERTFQGGPFHKLLGRDIRHTIEPMVRYRYVTGVNEFNRTLRFDARDVLSNTNEVEYGVTQRLFLRPARVRPCEVGELPNADDGFLGGTPAPRAIPGLGPAASSSTATSAGTPEAPASPQDPSATGTASAATADTTGGTTPETMGDGANPGIPVSHPRVVSPEDAVPTCGGTRESLRWRIVQRRYLNETFGKNVLVAGATAAPTAANPFPQPQPIRNVLETTLDLSGVAFLTGQPRALSPIVSELRLSATSHLDVEWDMNYDTVLNKFTQSNTFLDVHNGDWFGGVSYARLNAPGRFQRLDVNTDQNTTSLLSDFSQMRMLLGYGTPLKRGFSAAANVGLDLTIPQPQYGALEVNYNWNCCGLSVEYRKYELGSVRNENSYRFNFTLANIGTAGNLRRAERLF